MNTPTIPRRTAVPTEESLDRRLAGEADAVKASVLAASRRAGAPHVDLTEATVGAVFTAMLRRLRSVPFTEACSEFGSLGAAYACARVPLAVALAEVQLSAVTISHRWWEVTTPQDVGPMFALGQIWDGAIAHISATLADGYARELAQDGRHHVAREQLAAELVLGRPPTVELVRAAQVRVFAHYAVLAFTRPDGRTDDLSAGLSRLLGTSELLEINREGRTVLLVPAPEIDAPDRARAAQELFTIVSRALGLAVAGMAFADLADVPVGVGSALEAIDGAESEGLRGVVLVGGEAAAARRPRLVPSRPESVPEALVTWPVLVDTLRELYRQDCDHARTAVTLRITRGVLTRRLQRIRELAGVDPLGTEGRRRFLAELMLRPVSRVAS